MSQTKTVRPSPVEIHSLAVLEDEDGKQYVQSVYEDQDCGKIVGGGTCPQPLRIELAPLYDAAPELLAACEAAFFALGRMGANMIDGQNRKEWEQCRAAIRKARGEQVTT